MKQSLKKRILEYYRANQAWMHKGKIESLAKSGFFGTPSKKATGYLGETADRRLRELHEEGLLKYHPEKEGYYAATPPQKTVKYFVPALNKEVIKKIY